MTPSEVVQAYAAAIASRDLDAASTYLSEDFQFAGPVPEPIGKMQYVGLMNLMLAAFPDIDLGITVVGEDGNVVEVTHQLSGTHTGDLDLTPMGMGVFPASGRSFSMAQEHFEYVIEGDQIVSTFTEPIEGAGLPAIIAVISS